MKKALLLVSLVGATFALMAPTAMAADPAAEWKAAGEKLAAAATAQAHAEKAAAAAVEAALAKANISSTTKGISSAPSTPTGDQALANSSEYKAGIAKADAATALANSLKSP